jgi:hypothetical protein
MPQLQLNESGRTQSKRQTMSSPQKLLSLFTVCRDDLPFLLSFILTFLRESERPWEGKGGRRAREQHRPGHL